VSQKRKPRGDFNVRLSVTEKRLIARAARRIELPVCTFARVAMLAIARRTLRAPTPPAVVIEDEVRGAVEAVPLTLKGG